ncbi:uncharacterized protein [Venturia canescens]|uniref:uncharacterized protein n=1 Tax=Venturia canescens TaxID=32260 RepID=UPI001C9C30A7|nr:uncharacterized protein LOC122407125 [Venturia canescens]
MAEEESRGVEEVVESAEKLEGLKQIDCKVGPEETRKQESPSPSRSRNDLTPGTKTKRKARSTRRRLNAMMNNSSLHFSDTDSEGELTLINAHTRNSSPGKIVRKIDAQNPTISVTLEGGDNASADNEIENPQLQGFGNASTGTSRRGSFVENLTDVDEIYTSEPEVEGVCKTAGNRGLVVLQDNCYQGETDCEDFSNDEGDEPSPIYVAARSDILCDFSGGTITTKEGDGPFSIEVRNQMSFDCGGAEAKEFTDTPDIVIMPTTDSEDMDASDEEDVQEGACGQREMLEDFDLLAASQIVMKNINKMDNSLTVKDVSDNDISDCHTDVEDVD